MITKLRHRAHREEVRPGAASSLAVESLDSAGWAFCWHQHPECELTLIEAGSGLRQVGDAVERFAPGDLVLLGPGLPHSWASDPDCGRCRALVVKFPQALAGDQAEAQQLRALLSRARSGLVFSGAAASRASAELRLLVSTVSPIARLGHLHLALAELEAARARALAAAPPGPESAIDERLARVLALVHAEADGPLPAARAARLAGLHPAAFSRWFHRQLGVCFVRYVAEVRVAIACRLLAEGRTSILEVALASGFGSLSSCNRWFRLVRGTQPRRWRGKIAAVAGRARDEPT
jgi:AraC-like DNA-binding protein/mannose-6-phosphate isomerase-like protein (cupin superfamily)